MRDRLLRAYACVGQERIFYFKGIGFFNVVPQVLDQLLSVCHHGLVCRRRYLFEDLGFRGLGFRLDGVSGLGFRLDQLLAMCHNGLVYRWYL